MAQRHDASLALIGTMLARGLLPWRFVQRRFTTDLNKMKLLDWEKRGLVPVLNFVEMLLTEKPRASRLMMTQMDWHRLQYMRRIQDPAQTSSILQWLCNSCEISKHQSR